MKIVSSVLAKHKLTIQDLPIEIQEKIDYIQGMTDNYNKSYDEYEEIGESDEELENKLKETELYVIELDKELANEIDTLIEENNAALKDRSALESKEDVKIESVETKKDNYFGWIVGGVVLLGTLGLVNIFKNK